MQLAVPSLPSNSTFKTGSSTGSDSRSARSAGTKPPSTDSFEDLLSDEKPSVATAEKATDPTADRTTAEAAVIFSGWMPMTVPTDPQPVMLSTPDAATSADATATMADAAAPNAVASDSAAIVADAACGQVVGQDASVQNGPSVSLTSRASLGLIAAGSTFAAKFSPVTPTETSPAQANESAVKTPASVKAVESAPAATVASAVGTDTNAAETAVASAAASNLLATNGRPSDAKVSPTVRGDREKIASVKSASAGIAKTEISDTNKNFLNVDYESVENDDSELGIGVAKASASMSTAASNRSLSFTDDRSPLTSLTAEKSTETATTSATNASAEAHRAVDAILTASQRLTETNRGVNMQFSVGGAELAVRVEVRGGELHATFRTDSSELRSALANEWQAAAAQDSASPLRMVAPVFSSANSTSTGDFSQSASSQQQQRESSSQSSSSSSFERLFRGGSSSDDSSSPSDARTARTPAGSNQLLNAFA